MNIIITLISTSKNFHKQFLKNHKEKTQTYFFDRNPKLLLVVMMAMQKTRG